MALTDTQKQKILRYMGWSQDYIQENNRLYSAHITNRLNTITPETEADVVALLDRCIGIDAQLVEATAKLTISSIGNVRLNREEISMLRAERKRIIDEISTSLDIFSPDYYANYSLVPGAF